MSLTNNIHLSFLPGSVLSGILVYFILSYLIVPIGFTIPAAIIMSILVFGLARYFATEKRIRPSDQNRVSNIVGQNGNKVDANLRLAVSNIIFIIIYSITLIVTGFFSNPNQDLFIPWAQFSSGQLVLLISSILLCFFLPGYAIIELLDHNKHELKPLLKVLLAYIFSTAIIGFGGYISASIGLLPSEIKLILLGVFTLVLVTYIVKHIIMGFQIRRVNYFQKFTITIYEYNSEIFVFASLLAFVVLSSYLLYQGVIIGDQWFHHGRALSFLSGGFRSGLDDSYYPSFFHGVLAPFFSLSGVPSVNAYSSIYFLNILPVFAFYYFFKRWVPNGNASWRKASLLACTFFMLSSGFGWVNLLTMAGSTNPIYSPLSSAQLFHSVDTKTLDMLWSGAFVISSAPQANTGLTLIALPAGFILLGLLKEKWTSSLKYITIFFTTTTVGILSHDEFYLFIIVSSLLPLVFRLSENKNIMYLLLLSSMLFVSFLDIWFNVEFSTVRYYTSRPTLGIPLIVLMALFVGFVWILDSSRILYRLYIYILARQRRMKKVLNGHDPKYYLSVVTIAAIAYLYIFTFLVWGQLSEQDIQMQRDRIDLPWYIYPMKLGVTGLIGIAYILSYFFRKFEKELFIFGIITITALLLGPYYDENRFSKYIIVCLGAFASLFISEIIIAFKKPRAKPLLTGLVIGIIVTSASLSVLMFNGYIASAMQNPDIEDFSTLLHSRIFPSVQEISFLNYLHKNLNVTKDYVTVLPEYDPQSNLKIWKDQELANKIQAFVGSSVISVKKFFSNPYTVNASSLTGLYDLLNYSKTKYIIIPKENVIDSKLEYPIRFALENFRKTNSASNYTLLTVPSIAPPTSSIDGIALVYQPEGILLSSAVSALGLLNFDNSSFKGLKTLEFVNENTIDNRTLTILNGDKRSTMWTEQLPQKDINYIQAELRVLGKNDTTIGSSGVVFRSDDNEYHVSLNQKGLLLSEKSSNSKKEVLLSQDPQIRKERNVWYTMKILTVGNNIAIYLDDILKLKVPLAHLQNLVISKIGIRIDHNTAEFEPIKVGHMSQSTGLSLKKEIYYHLYYPLNELALSKAAYDTFGYGDMSALSHKIVMLTWDPASNNTQFKNYLRYVNDGGKLVVINTGNNFTGGFSKLLNITAGNYSKFDGIVYGDNDSDSQSMAVSGTARIIDSQSINSTVSSYYVNNGKKIAPFVVENKHGNVGGKIIFVNSGGYFNALFESPEQFLSLGRIPSVLNLTGANYTREYLPSNVETNSHFVGELRVSGPATITTHSLLLPNPSNIYTVGNISISNGSAFSNQEDNKNSFKNTLIENLTLSGAYSAGVETTGVVSFPSWASQYDYIGMTIPKTVNLTVKLLDKSGRAEFLATTLNDSGKYKVPITINGKKVIQFQHMGLQNSSAANQTFIIKRPEINASGDITIDKLNLPDGEDRNVSLRSFNASVNHSDTLVTNYKNISKMQYITYLNWIQTDRIPEGKQTSLKIPGDISERAKRGGVQVPWEEVIVSKNGIILLLSVVFIALIVLWRLRRTKNG